MQPTEIVQNAIGACEHIFRAKSLVEMDVLYVNAPALLGDIPHVQPAWRETYCLWKHVGRISEAITMHQSFARRLIAISDENMSDLNNILFPTPLKVSEAFTCHKALKRQATWHQCNHDYGQAIEFIREERIVTGDYEPDITELLQSTFDECKGIANRITKVLSKVDRELLCEELKVLNQNKRRTSKTANATKNGNRPRKKAGRKPFSRLTLTPEEKKIWQLHKNGGQSAAEIAHNISATKTQQQIQRIIDKAGKQFKRIEDRKKSKALTEL